MAAPVPPDDPDGERAGSWGLRVCPPSELGHVHFRHDDGARRPQLLHHERIVGRDGSFEQHGAAGGRQIERVVVVLQHDGDAVERRARTFRLALGVERARGLERFRIQRNDRVQRRTLAIVGLNSSQTALHQLLGRQRARVEGGVDVGDGRRIELDRLRDDRRQCGDEHGGQECGQS
jgi:hypothetical protein